MRYKIIQYGTTFHLHSSGCPETTMQMQIEETTWQTEEAATPEEAIAVEGFKNTENFVIHPCCHQTEKGVL
jgi:hypothetical protein